jgi:hypothetical protein
MACLSKIDMEVLKNRYGYKNLEFVPGFLPWQQIKSKEGQGSYCLYHGNLSVAENEAAALWLIEFVFSNINIPLIIAGSKSSKRLQKAITRHKHIKLVKDPSDERLSELIQLAHIHVLPSINRTGLKFKLLHTLCEGRFVIANFAGVEGSGVEDLVFIAEDAAAFKRKISRITDMLFTSADFKKREALLCLYNNIRNAGKL